MKNNIYHDLLSDSSKRTAEKAAMFVGSCEEKFYELLQIAVSEPYPIAMRAARVVHWVSKNNPFLIDPYHDILVNSIKYSKIDGVKRSFLKVFVDNVNVNNLTKVPEIIDICIELITNTKESFAVKCYSIDLLLKIAEKEPLIHNEVLLVLEQFHDFKSKALAQKVNKIIFNNNNPKERFNKIKF